MNEIPMLFAQVATVVVAMVAGLAGIALVTRALWKLTTRVTPREIPGISATDFRRLETAVESIAIEVERISEAQRYTVALLGDRVAAHEAVRGQAREALGAGPRAITPH